MVDVVFISNEEDTLLVDALFESFVEVVITSLDGGLIWEVKDADTSLWTFVVGGGECSEFLLSGGVPDLKGAGFAIDGGGVGFEVDSYGGEVGWVEFRFAESEEDGAFADCLWAYDYDLKGFSFDICLGLVHLTTYI